MHDYAAHVYREGKWWMIAIPEIDGLTQTRRLADVEAQARSLVSVDQDLAPSEIGIEVIVDHAGKVTHIGDRRSRLLAARELEAKAGEEARLLAAELAKDLASEGVPVRDIGTVIDLSAQRANQLIQAPRKGKATKASTRVSGRKVSSAKRAKIAT